MRNICLAVALLIAASGLVSSGPSFVNGLVHDGQELTCDLPEKDHIKNIGSRRDGAGMCVMSSIEMAARYHGLDQFRGLRDWCANEPGGGYPEKVVDQIRRYCKTKGIPEVPFYQYEGPNPEEVMEAIDKNGAMACITYAFSPRYNTSFIAHMVCSPMFRGKYGVVLDNNFINENSYEWMDRAELIRRMRSSGRTVGSGNAWVFVWLVPGNPPVPRN